MTVNRCTYRDGHDLEQDRPIGPCCGKPATQEIHWVDGRFSHSCMWHGVNILTDEAKALVVKVVAIV